MSRGLEQISRQQSGEELPGSRILIFVASSHAAWYLIIKRDLTCERSDVNLARNACEPCVQDARFRDILNWMVRRLLWVPSRGQDTRR
jgi:hypothetical protein